MNGKDYEHTTTGSRNASWCFPFGRSNGSETLRDAGLTRRSGDYSDGFESRAGGHGGHYNDAAPAITQTSRGRDASHRCDQCGARFGDLDDLQVHTLTAHYEDRSNPLPPYAKFCFDVEKVDFASCVSDARMGAFRGVQGENNSCYLDAALMAMFYANNTYDSLLYSPGRGIGKGVVDLEYARMYMSLHIVNNLRRRGFVPSMLVLEWRRMINGWFGRGVDFNNHCEEEEAGDFVRFLLERFGNESTTFVLDSETAIRGCSDSSVEVGVEVNGRPLHQEATSQISEVMMQLLPPSPQLRQMQAASLPWTLEQLLDDTLHSQGLLFAGLGTSLILQLPRYGKRERVIGRVVPDPELHVYSFEETQRQTKLRYELRAVIVIGTSHFVSYLRVPSSTNKKKPSARSAALRQEDRPTAPGAVQWLYYDSMSDRVGEQNIPIVTNVTEELAVLESPNAAVLVMQELSRGGRAHLRRIVKDMSIAFYGCAESPGTATFSESAHDAPGIFPNDKKPKNKKTSARLREKRSH